MEENLPARAGIYSGNVEGWEGWRGGIASAGARAAVGCRSAGISRTEKGFVPGLAPGSLSGAAPGVEWKATAAITSRRQRQGEERVRPVPAVGFWPCPRASRRRSLPRGGDGARGVTQRREDSAARLRSPSELGQLDLTQPWALPP